MPYISGGSFLHKNVKENVCILMYRASTNDMNDDEFIDKKVIDTQKFSQTIVKSNRKDSLDA
jgi:hypothetical protein